MNPTSDLIDKYNKGVYYIKDRAVSDKFLKTYRKIHDLAENTGSRLILTWPVTMKNKSFDLSGKEDKKKVSKLAVHLHNKNIRVYCDPSEFNLDLNLFFNSEYHPNTEGTAIRSERLARCLNTILAARDRK